MTLRDDLIPCVDDCRGVIDDLGLRRHTAATRLRTWTDGEPGAGEYTDTDTTITPKPKVAEPSPRRRAAAPGFYEETDRIVSKVSATYTEAQLTGGELGDGQTFYWLIDGKPYRVMSAEEHNFEWRIHLRQLNRG